MEIQMNDKITLTATKMILLLDDFGNKLIEAIQDGNITHEMQIMEMARNEIVAIFSHVTEEHKK